MCEHWERQERGDLGTQVHVHMLGGREEGLGLWTWDGKDSDGACLT